MPTSVAPTQTSQVPTSLHQYSNPISGARRYGFYPIVQTNRTTRSSIIRLHVRMVTRKASYPLTTRLLTDVSTSALRIVLMANAKPCGTFLTVSPSANATSIASRRFSTRARKLFCTQMRARGNQTTICNLLPLNILFFGPCRKSPCIDPSDAAFAFPSLEARGLGISVYRASLKP